MAEYLVQGESITAVADAIREKGGTTAPLSFPAGMAEAVRGIPSGGGDISLGLTAATVGQTIKVKAVDADGKPTAWEAVDVAGGETWEKIADVALTADTSVYELANFGIYRKIKVTLSRAAYVSGLNKNVWFRIRTANMSGTQYAALFMTSEYGYITWEITGEIGKTFTWIQKKTSNNAVAPQSVIETVDILSPANPSEYGFYIDFVDTSAIQDGDTVAVYGVKRHGG